MKTILGRFWRSRQGNFAMMTIVAFPALIAAVGASIDLSNLMSARSSLSSALDSAILASSHLKDKSDTRQNAFQAYFKENVAERTDLYNAEATLDVNETVLAIETKGRATADVKLHFAWIFGVTKKISVEAGAYEANDTLEVVLVLDNTGSMATNNRIGALRTAATSLVTMLEGVKSDTRSVKVSIVPFVTAVNVKGDGFKMDWIDQTGASSLNGVNFSPKTDHLTLFNKIGVAWKGCVEARPGTYNISDTAPTTAVGDTLFVPYLAPDDPGAASKPSGSYGNSADYFNNSYLDDRVALGLLKLDIIKSIVKYASDTVKLVTEVGPLTVGPNRACPTPIVPLTDDFNKLRTEISKMKEWNGSGTNVSEGLAWGMRALSPGEPYTQGENFKSKGVTKAVLLLTDGENVVYGSKKEETKSDYGSYGYLASGRFGATDQATAARNVDKWVLSVCDQLKGEDVQIYTVLLQADTAANRKLYQACASSAANYYPTNDVSQLESVFRSIGAAIARLRLTM